MNTRGIVVPALVLLLSGCGDGERREAAESVPVRAPYGAEGLAQMRFDVDPTLLGFTYRDSTLDLRFAPPRGLPPLDPAEVEQTRAALKQIVPEGTPFHGDPVRIFYDESRRLFMILATWNNWEPAHNPFPALTEYPERVRASMGEVEIQEDTYLLGEIGVYQLLLRNPILVNFRLILIREDRAPVQVDYLAPASVYPDVVKAIEASIGSIRPLED